MGSNRLKFEIEYSVALRKTLQFSSLKVVFQSRYRLSTLFNFKSTKCLIIQALRNRYDNRVVKLVRKLEKLDYKTRKCKIDLEFFNLSVENNVIPKFIQLYVGNKELRNSVAHRKCLNKLLQQEVINKKQRYKLLEKDLKSVKDELLLSINLFDYNHVYNIFLVKNDKSLRSHQMLVTIQK